MNKPHQQFSEEEQYILNTVYSFAYYCEQRRRFAEDECGFCKLDPKLNKVEFETDNWMMMKNAFPGTRPCTHMLLIVSKPHWRQLSEITAEAWTEFATVMEWLYSQYDLPGGGLFIRFGDMRLNAGTMRHLHWNLWIPDESADLLVPFYRQTTEADLERATEFARRYEAGERA